MKISQISSVLVIHLFLDLTCQAFPGPGSEHVVLMNPIREYVHHQDDHIHEGFEIFKKSHKKQYKSDEHDSRKHVYRQNLRYFYLFFFKKNI